MIPILQMPPPWAWATITGLRCTHGVKGEFRHLRGPAAVVATNTNYGVAQAMRWMKENGIEVPMKKDLHQGAMVGVVDIATCVIRKEVNEYLFLDEHPWQLVLVDPLILNTPVCSKRFKPKVGLPAADALAALAGHRCDVGRAYASKLREMLEES